MFKLVQSSCPWENLSKPINLHTPVYLSNIYCRYKKLLGTPIAFSVRCSLWKTGPVFLDLVQTFCELMIKGDFKLWWFPERSHKSTNTNSHFLGLEKVTTFVWYPTIVAEKLGYFNQVKTFWRPLISLPPKTPCLDPPLLRLNFSENNGNIESDSLVNNKMLRGRKTIISQCFRCA